MKSRGLVPYSIIKPQHAAISVGQCIKRVIVLGLDRVYYIYSGGLFNYTGGIEQRHRRFSINE